MFYETLRLPYRVSPKGVRQGCDTSEDPLLEIPVERMFYPLLSAPSAL
jgi:hypothetical protein